MKKDLFKKIKVIQLSGISFLLLVVPMTIFSYAINVAPIRAIVSVVPYPAVLVNFYEVRLSDYYSRLQVLEQTVKRSPNQDEKSGVLNKLIDYKVAEIEAARRGLRVNSNDVNEYYLYLKGLIGQTSLGKNYGLSEDGFKQLILKPDLISIRLQQVLSQDKSLNPDAYNKLQKVQSALNSGVAFETVAQQYSDDKGSGRIGGDIGFVGEADVTKELYDDIVKSNDGKVHTFVSRYGIHVYKVLNQDLLGPNRTARYHVQEIFIKTQDFNSWLSKTETNYKIIKIIK